MVFALVIFCISLSIMAFVTETKASTCYRLYLNWDCFGDYRTWDFLSVLVHDDLTFDGEDGSFGDWDGYGSSRYLQFYDGCQEFLGGATKQGFMQCTDGSSPGAEFLPGCWYLKKAKSYECDWYFFLVDTGSKKTSVREGSRPRPRE